MLSVCCPPIHRDFRARVATAELGYRGVLTSALIRQIKSASSYKYYAVDGLVLTYWLLKFLAVVVVVKSMKFDLEAAVRQDSKGIAKFASSVTCTPSFATSRFQASLVHNETADID
jgi:hypothetical protein